LRFFLRRHRRALEIVGLVLILIASFWQLFVEDVVRDIASDATHGRLGEQVAVIWQFLRVMSLTESAIELRVKYAELNDMFLGADPVGGSRASGQVESLTGIRAVMFLLGSALLVLSRVLEPTRIEVTEEHME